MEKEKPALIMSNQEPSITKGQKEGDQAKDPKKKRNPKKKHASWVEKPGRDKRGKRITGL